MNDIESAREKRIQRNLDELRDLTGDPKTRDRLNTWLERNQMAETTSIRIEQELLDRIDALVEQVAEMPAYKGIGRVTRSVVLRLALVKGLDALEEQLKESGSAYR